MIEKPYLALAELARKAQAVATKVALKAARLADSMATKAERIQARSMARAAVRLHAQALRDLERRPTIVLLDEVRHGRTSISFYRRVDHRRGRVYEFWTLDRDTHGGRVRLGAGSMNEFRDLRQIVGRTIGRGSPTQQRAEQAQPPPRQMNEEVRQSPAAQKHTRAQQTADGPKRDRTVWYALVHVEGMNPNGTARTRVVRNFTDLETVEAYRERHPSLALYRRGASQPFRQGTVINIEPSRCRDVAERLKVIGRNRDTLDGNERTAGLEHTAAKLDQQRPPPSLHRDVGRGTAKVETAEPGRESVPPAAEVRDNRHWTVGVWHGAKPPEKGDWILFRTGKERVEDRVMIPTSSSGETRSLEPGEKARYVVAKVVTTGPEMGAAIVRGSTRDRDYAVTRTATLVHQAEGKQRFHDRLQEQQERRLEESRRRHQDRNRERGHSTGF